MSKLDPAAVKAANQELWAKYPELHGRQLVMPQDAAYADKWNKFYKEFKKKQIAELPAKDNAAPPSAQTPPTLPPPQSVVQPCPPKAPCGAASKKCKDAIEKGLDAKGDPIPEDVHEHIVEVNEKIRTRAKQAKFLGYNEAVDALDHWANGCGKFKEIPAAKTEKVKQESWEEHKEKLKSSLSKGLKSKLASELASKGSPLPNGVDVGMELKAAKASQGLPVTDDDLAYYGSTIHSRVTYQCVKITPKDSAYAERFIPEDVRQVCYECTATDWKSWAEDNYDFEDGKVTPFLPSDAEMNLLASYGCGANYQRGSKSWTTPGDELKQIVCFEGRSDILASAGERWKKDQASKKEEAAEAKRGALPSAGPAEEAAGP